MEILNQIWDALRSGTLPDLGNWSYLILTILVFVEGPAFTLIGGVMAAGGILRVELVLLCAMLGNFLADIFWYLLGYFGGNRDFFYRYPWIRRYRPLVERFEENMRVEGVRMFFLTKLSLGMLTVPALLAAGLARVPWGKLILVSIAVEPVWNGLLVLAGYRLADYLNQLERGLRIGAVVTAAIVLVILIAMYRRMFRRIVDVGKEVDIDEVT
jgi:membrane protein DedA with SNARE-associated domain